MRARLSADPSTLDLNPRIDEQPEDYFVSLAYAGHRDLVAEVVDELILEVFKNAARESRDVSLRFLTRALRLCSNIPYARLKSTLKLILLEDDRAVWGRTLNTLHELAARSLLGLERSTRDLRFWRDVANMWEPSLPYALRAAIEIDLEEGLQLFWRLLDPEVPRRDHPYVDWATILDEADEYYREDEIRRVLERTFYTVSGTRDAARYEAIIRRVLGLPRFSRVHERTIGEIAGGYSLPHLAGEETQPQPGYAHFIATKTLRSLPSGAMYLPEQTQQQIKSISHWHDLFSPYHERAGERKIGDFGHPDITTGIANVEEKNGYA